MLWWFLTITIILILAYTRSPPRIWAPVLVSWIIISVITHALSITTALLDLLLLAIISTPLFFHDLRRSLISDKLFILFQQQST